MIDPAGRHPHDPPRADAEVIAILTTEPLSVQDAHDAVLRDDCGGVGIFSGMVRDHHEGDAVTSITYEAWEAKARAALRAVGEQVLVEHPTVRVVYLAHRIGPHGVGDVSVVTAASAPHRAESIAASEALIDLLKANVPIWKHEELADGSRRWPEA